MDQYLIKINNLEDAPPDSYIIYDIPKGTYYCKYSNYTQFSRYFIYTNTKLYCMTMDLSSTASHSLFFDIDVKLSETRDAADIGKNNMMLSYYRNVFLRILKSYFAQHLKHFIVIGALRPSGGGLHVHMPEVTLSHDDYIYFCSQIQSRCSFTAGNQLAQISLDIPSNFSLAKSSKPHTDHYEPVLVDYFDSKHNQHTLNLTDNDALVQTLTKVNNEFKCRKENAQSFFNKILALDPMEIKNYLYELMMPVVTPYRPLYKLVYSTGIDKYENHLGAGAVEDNNRDVVATFTYKSRLPYVIVKQKEFEIVSENTTEWLKCQKYLKLNAFIITDFQTKNRALKMWYKSYNNHDSVITGPEMLKAVNQSLKEDNMNFKSVTNPLDVLMRYDKGYYFLPVFYALCNTLKISSTELITTLRNMFEDGATTEILKEQNRFVLNLLDKLDRIDPRLIENICQDFTLDTILYCGSNQNIKSNSMREKLLSIIQDMTRVLMFTTSSDDMIEHIRRIQERYLPIVVVTYRHSCKKPLALMWNSIKEYWQEIMNKSEVLNLINNIWSNVKAYLKRMNVYDKEIYKEMNLSYLVSSILSETNVDRKVIDMDRHKWHVRTDDGILDLLTGHVGATVPEFYMSQRRLSIPLNRHQLMAIRDQRSDLMDVYETLTNKRFFQTFVKHLLTDRSDDIHKALLSLMDREEEKKTRENDDGTTTHSSDIETAAAAAAAVGEDEVVDTYDYKLSMTHFYVHICKYNSFEYDRLMYFLDILSSTLISTNYNRKFFIFKGETRNGKSKFFQMIARVFGGYCYTIRSVNLHLNSAHGLNAQPELATSLFGCRVVNVEEMSGKLNENLVKEITGNSATSFRNLYEQNQGGIPTAKLFASTNTFPECTATEAFKDRVVAFPFESSFTKEADTLKTSEQVIQGKYVLDTSDSVIEDSYVGFFIMMYLHLVKNIDLDDGMIHYRPEPLCLVEFKANFLFMTDIYIQFKQYVDVQIVPDGMTTLNDLKSAVRFFLKNTRNNSVQESEIILKFDMEYRHLKRTEVNLGYFSTGPSLFDASNAYEPITCNNIDIADEEMDNNDTMRQTQNFESSQMMDESYGPRPAKRQKKPEEQMSIVYYQNIAIKNLRKVKNYK